MYSSIYLVNTSLLTACHKVLGSVLSVVWHSRAPLVNFVRSGIPASLSLVLSVRMFVRTSHRWKICMLYIRLQRLTIKVGLENTLFQRLRVFSLKSCKIKRCQPYQRPTLCKYPKCKAKKKKKKKRKKRHLAVFLM